MLNQSSSVADEVLNVIQTSQGCTVQDLSRYFRELSWPELFNELYELSQSGQVLLIQNSKGTTSVLRIP